MPDGRAPRGGDPRLHISHTTIRGTGPGGQRTERSAPSAEASPNTEGIDTYSNRNLKPRDIVKVDRRLHALEIISQRWRRGITPIPVSMGKVRMGKSRPANPEPARQTIKQDGTATRENVR